MCLGKGTLAFEDSWHCVLSDTKSRRKRDDLTSISFGTCNPLTNLQNSYLYMGMTQFFSNLQKIWYYVIMLQIMWKFCSVWKNGKSVGFQGIQT